MTKREIILCVVVCVLLSLSACQSGNATAREPAATAIPPSATATSQASPTITVTPTLTLEPVLDTWFMILQEPTWWEIRTIAATEDGGFIGGGSINLEGDTARPWVGKFNPLGEIEWQQIYGTQFGRIYTIITLPDGGYVFAGFSRTGPEYTTTLNAILVRLDSQGAVLWNRVFAGASTDRIIFVHARDNGRIAFLGETESFEDELPGIWLGEVDADGELLWHQMLHRDYFTLTIGLAIDENGNLLVAGWNGASWAEIVDTLLRFDHNGELVFDYTFDGIENYGVQSFTHTNDWGFLLGGTIGHLSLLDENGEIKTEYSYGRNITIKAMAEIPDGLILAGSYWRAGEGDFGFVMKIDHSGEMVWAREVDGVREIQFATVSDNGRILLLGSDRSQGGALSVILSLDSHGQIANCEQLLDHELSEAKPPSDALQRGDGLHRIYAYLISVAEVEFPITETDFTPTFYCRAASGD